MFGLCGGLGSSGSYCLCSLEMYELCWYLLLLCCGGPEMSVPFVCC